MKALLFGNTYRPQAKQPLQILLRFLADNKIDTYVEQQFYQFITNELNLPADHCTTFLQTELPAADIALSIGGDGTLLNTAHCIGNRNIPILGINTGNLGFLADCSPDNIEQFLNEYMQGKCSIEERALLAVQVDGRPQGFALNEIAILKQDSSSMIRISARIDNQFLNDYLADGLIVATPTGSTAYSMSVGGPIVSPLSQSIILSPVAPHSLSIRPLVIPDNMEIKLQVQSRENRYLLSIDGKSRTFNQTNKVTVRRAPYTIKIVKQQEHTYYQTLRTKLMWGKNPSK